jgi:hypothetical protein
MYQKCLQIDTNTYLSAAYDLTLLKKKPVARFLGIKISLLGIVTVKRPIPVVAQSKAWVCDRSLIGIAGSNPVEDTGFCLL